MSKNKCNFFDKGEVTMDKVKVSFVAKGVHYNEKCMFVLPLKSIPVRRVLFICRILSFETSSFVIHGDIRVVSSLSQEGFL